MSISNGETKKNIIIYSLANPMNIEIPLRDEHTDNENSIVHKIKLDQRSYIQKNDEDEVLEWNMNDIPCLHGDNYVIQSFQYSEELDEEPYLMK